MMDIKNEILKQLQNTEVNMKEQFRTSLEQNNSKLTMLSNNVKENSSEILSIMERITKLESEHVKKTYDSMLKYGSNNSGNNPSAGDHMEKNHESCSHNLDYSQTL